VDPEIGICGRRRSVARVAVDGRYRQEPWEDFNVDSNILQFWGLYAEVLVVTWELRIITAAPPCAVSSGCIEWEII